VLCAKIEVQFAFQGLVASGHGPGNCLKRERGVQGEGSIVSGMAGRYATALFELTREERAIDAVKADLDRFDALLAESPDLTRLVRSPVFSAEQQAKALTAVLEAAGIGDLAAKFLNVLAANRRLFAVGTIIKDFRKLVAHHKGEVIADVTLAERPSDTQLTAIRDALHAVTSREVQVEVKVEPAIIGGLIVKLGSRMVDSSLRTKLRSLKHAMKEVS
jgi:F-type H+-transporting ATPase subunit delta